MPAMVQSCRKMFSQLAFPLSFVSCRANRPLLSLSHKGPTGLSANRFTTTSQNKKTDTRKAKKHMIKNSKRHDAIYIQILVNELNFQPTFTNHVIIMTYIRPLGTDSKAFYKILQVCIVPIAFIERGKKKEKNKKGSNEEQVHFSFAMVSLCLCYKFIVLKELDVLFSFFSFLPFGNTRIILYICMWAFEFKPVYTAHIPVYRWAELRGL